MISIEHSFSVLCFWGFWVVIFKYKFLKLFDLHIKSIWPFVVQHYCNRALLLGFLVFCFFWGFRGSFLSFWTFWKSLSFYLMYLSIYCFQHQFTRTLLLWFWRVGRQTDKQTNKQTNTHSIYRLCLWPSENSMKGISIVHFISIMSYSRDSYPRASL